MSHPCVLTSAMHAQAQSIQLRYRGRLNKHDRLLGETEIATSYRESLRQLNMCISLACDTTTTAESRVYMLSSKSLRTSDVRCQSEAL
jgi:hypothetical protein